MIGHVADLTATGCLTLRPGLTRAWMDRSWVPEEPGPIGGVSAPGASDREVLAILRTWVRSAVADLRGRPVALTGDGIVALLVRAELAVGMGSREAASVDTTGSATGITTALGRTHEGGGLTILAPVLADPEIDVYQLLHVSSRTIVLPGPPGMEDGEPPGPADEPVHPTVLRSDDLRPQDLGPWVRVEARPDPQHPGHSE